MKPANALPVRTRIGHVPAYWPESAVYIADLHAIFYGEPEKTRQLQQEIAGFHGYGGRLAPILDLIYQGGHNTLVLPEAPVPELLTYFADCLGLSIPNIVVVDHRAHATLHDGVTACPDRHRALAATDTVWVDGYVTDPPLESLSTTLGKRARNTFHASRDANDKVALTEFLVAAGMPVFDGDIVAPGAPLTDSLDALRGLGYSRAVVRSALGASGFGVATVPLDHRGAPDLPTHLTRENAVLVQGWVEPGVRGVHRVTSPSVQFFVGDEAIDLFDLTGQLLRDARIHEGNIAPPVDITGDSERDAETAAEILAQAAPVAQWVAGTGYRGMGSIDFLVATGHTPTGGSSVSVTVCEVNARVTGATYPALLARHFRPERAWLMRNIGFQGVLSAAEVMAALDAVGPLFRPGSERGILPINIIRDAQGRAVKCQLLFLADTPRECEHQARECLAGLPVESGYDRD